MLLRTKLFVSFAGGVALSALICFVAWQGMTTMEGRSQQAVLLEDASVALLRAKVAQVRFLYTGNREEVGLTRDFITKSRDLLARAASHSISRDEAERLQTMSAKEEEFAGLFERLVEQTDAITAQDDGVADIVRAVYTSMDALRTHLETELATVYSSQTFKAYTALGTARILFEQARTSMWRYRAFLPNAETSAAATKAIESASAALQQVERQAEDPETTRLVAVIRNDMQSYHGVFDKMLALRETQQANLSNIHGFILGIIDDMVAESVRAGNSLAQSQTTARVQLLGLTAGVALLGLIMALLLTRSVMNQLGKDPGELADIARRVTEGDTSAAMNNCHDADCRGVFKILVDMVRSLVTHLETAKRESEHAREESDRALKAVAEAEAMRKQAETARQDGMQEAVSSLNSIVYVVNSAADSLSSQLHAAEQGSSMQSDRINETADSMDQMNIAMLQVAKNAAMAAEVSSNMRNKAESGSRIMESAMEGIQAVSTQSLAVRESMAALNDSLGAIDQILAVISDIADQTNLLALNAAIEAARAGESGRGFAVVADEVRKLAEKTMASTTDVANVIRGIRQSAEANMRQVDASVAHIQKATGLVNQSGGVLKEIAILVDNTADQVRAIAAASEEQSATTESINHSMAQVNSIAVDTTHSMHEAEQAVHALAEQAQALMGLIKKMDKST